MAAPLSSTCYSSVPATSSDNKQHQSCFSSLENFLFLPQLAVNGDDAEDKDANFSLHQNPRQDNEQQLPQEPSFSLAPMTSNCPISSSKTSSSSVYSNTLPSTDYENDDHTCQRYDLQSATARNNSCGISANQIPSFYERRNCNSSSNDYNGDHVCGGDASSNSLFPFIAANDTVMGSSPSVHPISSESITNRERPNNFKSEINFMPVFVQEKEALHKLSSSSMTILIRNNSTNRSHNDNYSQFYFAANHQQRSHLHRYPHQNRDHHHHQCSSRRRLLVFRICQAFSIFLCVAFLSNIVKSSIWAKDDYYENRVDSYIPPAPLSSLTSSSLQQNRLIQSWNMPSIISPPSSSLLPTSFNVPKVLSDLTSSNSHNLFLLDKPNFRFLMNNKTKCNIHRDVNNYIDDGTSNNNDTSTAIFFMIIVHSAPQNFQERQAIRETWGSLQRLGQFHIRLVFLLGQDKGSSTAAAAANEYDKRDESKNNNYSFKSDNKKFHRKEQSPFDLKIQEESQQYGDIVTGSFHDSYRNLTYKHLMGYLWVLNHCAHAKFIIKADDDAFIDIFQLFKFIVRTFGEDPEAALICNVFPEGTKPVRRTDKHGKKWAVTYEEYPYEVYPKYCGGLAYLATPNVIQEIYRMSQSLHNKYFWIDDVYVTGILRKLAHVEPFYLNLRYSYDPEEYRKWLHSSKTDAKNNNHDHNTKKEAEKVKEEGVTAAASESKVSSNEMKNERRQPATPQKLPFMIVHLDRGVQLGREMRELWNKTWDVWSESGLIF